jgi:hypothetical protein
VHALVVALATATLAVGDPVVIRTVGAAPVKPVRVYLSSSSRTLTPVGTLARGARQLRFRLPPLAADVYAPATRAASGRIVVGHGRLFVQAVAPAGFAPLGAEGCAPASPRSAFDVFGTAAGTELWALFMFGPPGSSLSGPTVTYDGVVGKDVKIVWRRTAGVPTVFYSVSPDGRTLPPVSGPTPHVASSWNHPGAEWGSVFVFDMPGCWRIRVGSPPAAGDVWLVVRS